jgi:outer membrane protein assembly factor BamA
VLPVIGSAPETGVVGGATVLRVHRTDAAATTRPSAAQAYASYTAKHQVRLFADVDRWSPGNVWRVNAHAEFQRYPLPYFGIGGSTPEAAEEWYTARSTFGSLTVQRKLPAALFAAITYRLSSTTIVETADDGVLRDGAVPGTAGGRVGQLQLAAMRDTRDNIFAPASGSFVQVATARAAAGFGSDYGFARHTLDARRYWSLGGGTVLARPGVAEATRGDAPFDQLSLVGSSTILRGYPRGRYRDRDLAAAQAELRQHLTGRLGAALFAGAGGVAHSLADLRGRDLVPSYGLGLRWLLLPREGTTVRIDYGRGKGSGGLYVAFNEAF